MAKTASDGRRLNQPGAWFALAGAMVLSCGAVPAAQVQIPCSYTARRLPSPGSCFGFQLYIQGATLSPNGRYVCGQYIQCLEYDEACAVDTSIEPWQVITIPRPPGVYSAWANDVNDNGLVVGGCWRTDAGMRGWTYQLPNGPWTELAPVVPARGWCEALAVNASNTVVGYRSLTEAVSPRNAFIWNAENGFTDLGVMNGPSSGARDINDNNVVTGWTGSDVGSPNSRGFVLADGQPTIFGAIPNGSNSWAGGLNNAGEFVLSGFLIGGGSRGYLWSRNTLTELPPLPGYMSSNGSCTNAFLVYGGSGTGSNHVMCFWQNLMPFNAEQLILTPGYHNFGLAVAKDSLHLAGTAKNAQNETLTIYLIPNFTVEGDATCDGIVSVNDLYQVINNWGSCGTCRTDFNNDDIVNVLDLLYMIDHWTFSK